MRVADDCKDKSWWLEDNLCMTRMRYSIVKGHVIFREEWRRGPFKFHRKTIVRLELVFVHQKQKIHQLKVERMPCFQLVHITTSPCVCRGWLIWICECDFGDTLTITMTVFQFQRLILTFLQRTYYNRFHYFKTYAHWTQFIVLSDYYTPSRLHYSLSMINTKTDTSLVDKSSSPRFR